MSVTSIADTLEGARRLARLTLRELWIGYYAIGGKATPEALAQFLAGSAVPEPSDYDVIAQALNDRLVGQHLDHPVPYADELAT